MAGDPSLALQLGAKLAGCAQFDVIGEQLVVGRVRARSTMIRSGFNMKRDITPFSPHAASRHVIPATIASSAKCIDLFPIPRLQQSLSITDPFPSNLAVAITPRIRSLRATALDLWTPVVRPRLPRMGRLMCAFQLKMRGQGSHCPSKPGFRARPSAACGSVLFEPGGNGVVSLAEDAEWEHSCQVVGSCQRQR